MSTEGSERKASSGRRRRRWLLLLPLALPLVILAGLNLWLRWLAPQQLTTERRQVQWSRAWTLWPTTVHVKDLQLVQRGPTQEWQLSAEEATVALDLLGLRRRHFHIRRGRGNGVSFFLRRRLAEGVAGDDVQHLPPIGDLALTQRESGPRAGGRNPWRVTLGNLDLRGVRELWVDEIRAVSAEEQGIGRVAGTAQFQGRGPMQLVDVVAELDGASLFLGADQAVDGLALTATLALAETPVPKLRTLEALDSLTAVLQISGDVPSLRFLRELIPEEKPLRLEGEGRLEADLKLEGREFREGSTLRVDARQLEVEVGWLDAAGQGAIDARVELEEGAERLDLRVDLEGLDVAASRGNPMSARASDLDLVVTGFEPRVDRPLERTELKLELPRLDLPNLAEFQPLLPEGLDLQILGGKGTLETRMNLEGGDQNASFRVLAEEAQLRFRGTDVFGRLSLSGRTTGQASRRSLDLSDVGLSFQGATRPSGAGARPVPVRADLGLDRLRLAFPEGAKVPRIAPQTLRLRGDVDDLGWWSNPFSDSGWLRLGGEAELSATLRVLRGAGGKMRLSSPSEAELDFPLLDLALSEWSTSGPARLRGELGGGGRGFVELNVRDPLLEHPEHASFQLPSLQLTARGSGAEDLAVTAEAESTRPFTLTALNSYVPTDSFRFAEGLGTMAGRLDWTGGDAQVALSLVSSELTAELLDEPFTGKLRLDVELEAGARSEEALEVSRGQLRLEDVAFPGIPREDGEWWLVADLQEGSVSTGRPLGLDADVRLRLRDTEPIVRMVGESHRAVRWFRRILEVNDIDGTARLVLAQDGAQLRDVDIRGQGLEIVGEIDLRPPGRALLLIDYKALRAGFEMDGEQRDVKVLRPKSWFEARRAAWR
ncbi:MAG: hypothetical protein AAGK22_07445 [Acidobacteriota bacterium]